MADKPDSTKARLIQDKVLPYSRLATTEVRPFRLAFIINEKMDQEQLRKIFEYNCLIWGGYYNLMVPTDGITIREDWLVSLVEHDPDYIFSTDDLPESIVKTINERIQPFRMWKWRPEFVERHLKEEAAIDSLPIHHLLTHLAETHPAMAESNLRLPSIDPNSPFALHILAQFGMLPKNYNDFCVSAFKAQYCEMHGDTLKDYFSLIRGLREQMTPIDLTRQNLSTRSQASFLSYSIVVSGTDLQRDLCLFWDLRMRPHFTARENTIIVPYSALKKPNGIDALADYCADTAKGTNHIALVSASLAKHILVRLRDRLAPLLNGVGIDHVDIWHNQFRLNGIVARESKRHEEIRIDDHYFRCSSLAPGFGTGLRGCKWVMDFALDANKVVPDAFVPPKFPMINDLLSGSPEQWMLNWNNGYSIRLAGDRMSFRVDENDDHILGRIPSSLNVMERIFHARGFSTSVSDKCKYTQSMIKIIGGLEEARALTSAHVRDLMHKMRKGNAFTLNEMLRILRPGSDKGATLELVSSLAIRQYIRRGLKLHCPACDMTRWYPLKDIREKMECEGCLTSFQPPIDAPFRYDLNELVSRAVEQGGLPVILTLLFLQSLAQKSFLFVPGLKVTKAKETDLDIVASCDGHLILCECKDLGHDVANAKDVAIYRQIKGIVDIALEVEAPLVFFSALSPTVSSVLQSRIQALNKRLKGSVAIHLLTATELEKSYRPMPDKMAPSNERPATLTEFLPVPKHAKQGWIRNPGTRTMAF